MTQFRIVQLAWMKALDEWSIAVTHNERHPEDKFWEEYRESTWNELAELQAEYLKLQKKGEKKNG